MRSGRVYIIDTHQTRAFPIPALEIRDREKLGWSRGCKNGCPTV